jgi:8-oxo-dGTP pyrophosphatase MutT (NUDIX family)
MKIRESARALLIDPDGQILLARMKTAIHDPAGIIKSPYWLTPGGGPELNETLDQALVREIREECGIERFDVGPVVWFWEHILEIKGTLIQCRDHFFVVKTAKCSISTDGMLQYERDDFCEYKWWKASEIKASGEVFAPPMLGQLLEDLLKGDKIGTRVINIG